MENTLDSLAIKYNTDKGPHRHNYTKIYERYLSNRRENIKSILEIGVFGGASLYMWKDYFHNAEIHGLDINPSCKDLETERVHIHICSQTDKQTIDNIFRHNTFDIIIDDSSHLSEHQIDSFLILFDKLNSGGYYIIEDVCCSYWKSHGGSYKKPGTAIEFFKDKIDDVNFYGFKGINNNRNREYIVSLKKELTYFEKNTSALHFHNSIIIIEKI